MAKAIRHPFAVAVLVIATIESNAIAATSAYVTSGNLVKTVDQCLKDMRSIAEKSGFTVAQETLIDKNGMAGDFHADKANAQLHFTARCNSVSKTWAISVSGTNNDQTFAQFRNFYTILP